MTTERRRRRRRHPLRPVLLGLAVLLVFVIGIALGQALSDNPPSPNTIIPVSSTRLRVLGRRSAGGGS